ncbi:MAG: hypothetical protein NT121_15165 [Chloroflexi bacterium]|nr:hypothetical protein [Chloroflexota bacterium]
MRNRFWLLLGLLMVGLSLSCNFVTQALSTPPAPMEETVPTQEMLATQELPVASNLPELAGDWQIKLSQSGGLAGVQRSIEIFGSGEMTVDDENSKAHIVDKLAAEQLASLEKLVASSQYQPDSGSAGGCADCFVYMLEITSGGETFQAQLDDVTLADSGLNPLVDTLGRLMKAALEKK